MLEDEKWKGWKYGDPKEADMLFINSIKVIHFLKSTVNVDENVCR